MSNEDEAHRQLVDHLIAKNAISSDRIEAAFRMVARHSFLPGRPTRVAYEDRPVVLRVDEDGKPTSTASQPTMIAKMLDQLDAGVGDDVLEIGTGSGYEAALLAEIVGQSGSVVSIEIDEDLAEAARSSLARSEHREVVVVTGDGRLGYEARAPYDRIIVTAGSPEVENAWRDQLVSGGRLVVPLVNRWGSGFSVAFEKSEEQLVRLSELPCSFVLIHGE